MSAETPSNRERITGQLRRFIDLIDLEIIIQKQKNKAIADLLSDFRQSCEGGLAVVVQSAIDSDKPQRLAVLSVDMSVKNERWRIINDTLGILRELIKEINLSLGKSSYNLNEFIMLEKEDSSGFDDETIIVDFVLPQSIRKQLSELDAPAATAEPPAPSPLEVMDGKANKNAAFAKMLPRLLNGIDAELAELITAAAQRTPGSGNIYLELPLGMNRAAVLEDLRKRFGELAYPQKCKVPGHGANAIQITVS